MDKFIFHMATQVEKNGTSLADNLSIFGIPMQKLGAGSTMV